jgi:hypothetical protein
MHPWVTRSLALLPLLLAGEARPASAELTCSAVPDLMKVFVRHHVQHTDLTPEVEQRTIETWLRRQDPTRSLLTTAELDAQRASLRGLFDRIKAGDCAQVLEVHKALVRQHERSAKFVREFVTAEGYAVDEKATVALDPEKRGNPATAAERET